MYAPSRAESFCPFAPVSALLIAGILVTLLMASPAAAYHVPWEDYVVDAALGNPMAITALEIDGLAPLEVVVLGDELPVHMSILSSTGGGSYTASPLFTIDEFGAATVRLDRLTALATYDTTGATTAKIVIAGTPAAGASPYYRIYSISSGFTLTQLAEVEMNWLDFSTVGEVRCVTDIGDLDGNGTNDLAFGFPDDNRVEIVFLDVALAVTGHQTIQQGVGGFVGNLMVDGELLVVPIGPTDEMGFSLTRLADYTPGSPDPDVANLAVGVPGHDSESGMVSLIALNSDGTVYFDRGWNATALGTVSLSKSPSVELPAEAGSRFGASVTWVPEFNYDFDDSESTSAQGDLLVGMPGLDEAGLHPDPDPLATPRDNVGGIAMLDVLVFNAIYTENWLVIGDRSGGMCRQLPAGAALGRNAVVVGDVFEDGTADYLVLGDEVTTTHGDNAEMLLLDMKDARLWHWEYAADDHWIPVGPIEATDRLAVLGITSTEAKLPDYYLNVVNAFKIGSCFNDDPVSLIGNGCSDLTITGDAIIDVGGILYVPGDLTVDGTLTNKGTIVTIPICNLTKNFVGTGDILLTASGELRLGTSLNWDLGPAVNNGLITTTDSTRTYYLDFNDTLINNGEIALNSRLDPFHGSAGLVAFSVHNHGLFSIITGNSGFDINGNIAAPLGDRLFVNYPGATLDLDGGKDNGSASFRFQSIRPVNQGTMRFRNHFPGAWAEIRYEGLDNSGALEFYDGTRLSIYASVQEVLWNGGTMSGDGVFELARTHATVNADWTVPAGIELRLTGDFRGGSSPFPIASGATLLIEGVMNSQSRGYPGEENMIDGPGTFRIAAGGELWVQQNLGPEPYGQLRIATTGGFECAGSIFVHESDAGLQILTLEAPNGLTIEPGGQLVFNAPNYSSGMPVRQFNGNLTNQGTVQIDVPGGGSTQWLASGAVYDNQGTIEVLSDLTVGGGGVFVLDPASSIEIGAGATMTVPTPIDNPGSLGFGEAGVLSVAGNFTQSGPLSIELGNAQPSAGNIQATGTADFTGDFALQTAPGFDPSVASSHVLASYGNITTSVFGSESFPAGDGIDWRLSYDPTELLVNLHLFTLLSYDLAGGALTDLAPGSGLVRPSMASKMALPTTAEARLASSGTGKELYALLDPGPSASLMAIDPSTLMGTTSLPLTGTAVGSASAIVVDRAGNIVVAFDGTSTPSLLGQITRDDLLAGHAVLSGIRRIVFSPPTPGAKLDLMAVSPEGQLYALDNYGGGNIRLWSIDRSTGTGTYVGEVGYSTDDLDGMEFLGDELWATCSSAGELIRIDPSDGSVVQVLPLVDELDDPRVGLGGLTWRAVADVGTVLRLRTVPEGGALLIDAPGYAPPPMVLRYDLYRGSSLAELAYGAPSLIDSQATLDFVDATTVDYTTYYYRVDVIADDGIPKAEILDSRLYSKPGISRPWLVLSELAPSEGASKIGEMVEIENLSSVTQDLTGYRLSNGAEEETLTGSVPGNGFFVHTLSIIELSGVGGTLSLLAPDSDFVFDSVGWGTEGGAPAVPQGFSISRVSGTTAENPDATSFDISSPSFGSENTVEAPALGSSIVVNEVYFEGTGGEDYVEIINPSGSTIVLSGFAISDGVAFVDTIETGVQLPPGQLFVLDTNSAQGFDRDLVQSTLYLYQITELGTLQRIDQLGWGSALPDFAPPAPVAPNDAVVRAPDGVPAYLGDQGANWIESGGDLSLFYGPPSPGERNVAQSVVTYRVDPLGGGDYLSIGQALAAATPGVKILIEPGNYAEALVLSDGVDLTGNGDSENPVLITGDGLGPAISGSGLGSQTRVSNLRIESTSGGMQLVDSSPTLSSLWFVGNHSTGDGAALSIDGGAPSISGCVFQDNTSDGNGGAVGVVSGAPLFSYCLFVHNTSLGKGGAIYTGGGTIEMHNCSLDQNGSYESQGGSIHNLGAALSVSTSTLTNGVAGASLRNEGGGSLGFSCGLIFNHPEPIPLTDTGIVLDNVLEEDPLFCQASAMNYAYSSASPLSSLQAGCGSIIGTAGPPCNPTTPTGAELPPRQNLSRLLPAMPNPFNPSTSLRFELAHAGRTQIELYDVRGRHIATPLAEKQYGPGIHQVTWQGRDSNGLVVASGVYFAVLRLNDQRMGSAQRLVLLK